jgi:hypothetical protein
MEFTPLILTLATHPLQILLLGIALAEIVLAPDRERAARRRFVIAHRGRVRTLGSASSRPAVRRAA